MLSNLIENLPSGGGTIDPGMLSDILADISQNSAKIDANMMGVDAAALSVAMLSDESATMKVRVD